MKDLKCVFDFQIRIFFDTENMTNVYTYTSVERIAKSAYYFILLTLKCDTHFIPFAVSASTRDNIIMSKAEADSRLGQH